ncbi:MAG TPA: hypothetical protein VI544_01360 [Candidatus Nanoarchaeia archaeon]|nr:hypothetical protein [Candidatus Nanoarchaeia archaeon]
MGKKLRINITVDRDNLARAKTKLGLFGGKLSTLFNAYLSEFVESMEKSSLWKRDFGEKERKELERRLKEIEVRIKRLENAKT